MQHFSRLARGPIRAAWSACLAFLVAWAPLIAPVLAVLATQEARAVTPSGYVDISVPIRFLDATGSTGNLYANLYQKVILANGDIVYPQKFTFPITSGTTTGGNAGYIRLPCTDASTPRNVPFTLVYTPTGGQNQTLGNIIPPSTVNPTLAALLIAGGTTYTVNPVPINVSLGGITYIASLTLLANTSSVTDQSRVLVTNYGIYRWDANSSATADGLTVVATTLTTGRWILEVAGGSVNTSVLNVKGYGALGDGSTNDTASFLRATTALTATSGGTLYVPPGTYMINATAYTADGDTSHPFGIRLPANTRLQIDPAATLKTIPNSVDNSALIMIKDTSNVTIEGGVLDGNQANHIGSSGVGLGMNIWSYGSSKVTIADLTTKNAWGDGVYLAGTTASGASDFVTLRNVVSDGNRRQGMSIVYAKHVTSLGSTFENTSGTSPQCGIDVEPNGSTGSPCEDIVFTACRFLNNSSHGFETHNGSQIKRITLEHCTSSGNAGAGILFSTALDAIVNGCIVQGNSSKGIQATAVTNWTVTNNITDTNGDSGYYASGCTGVVFHGNQTTGDLGDGFTLVNTPFANISNNVITNCQTSGVVPDSNSTGCAIAGNVINVTGRYGITATAYSTVTGNTIYGANQTGVRIGTGASNSVVSSNQINMSGDYGIFDNTATSGDTNIVGNMVTSSNQLNGGYSNIAIQLATKCLISGNICRQGSQALKPLYGLRFISGSDNRVVGNDLTGGGSTADYLDAGTRTLGIPKPAMPTTGTWVVNDVVVNSAATAAAPISWMCLTAGTPGTFGVTGYAPGLAQTITASTGTVLVTSGIVYLNRAGVIAVTLPDSTYAGPGFTTTNGDGNASATNIYTFVLGSGTTIAGAPTIDSPYGSLDWVQDASHVWHAK